MQDWNGFDLPYAQSRGGVIAVADFSRNLIHPANVPWPPACIVQKLYGSTKILAFPNESRDLLRETLGYYSDLQSLHSEDAITWSFFGPLAYLSSVEQAHAMNWILARIGRAGGNSA